MDKISQKILIQCLCMCMYLFISNSYIKLIKQVLHDFLIYCYVEHFVVHILKAMSCKCNHSFLSEISFFISWYLPMSSMCDIIKTFLFLVFLTIYLTFNVVHHKFIVYVGRQLSSFTFSP